MRRRLAAGVWRERVQQHFEPARRHAGVQGQGFDGGTHDNAFGHDGLRPVSAHAVGPGKYLQLPEEVMITAFVWWDDKYTPPRLLIATNEYIIIKIYTIIIINLLCESTRRNA